MTCHNPHNKILTGWSTSSCMLAVNIGPFLRVQSNVDRAELHVLVGYKTFVSRACLTIFMCRAHVVMPSGLASSARRPTAAYARTNGETYAVDCSALPLECCLQCQTPAGNMIAQPVSIPGLQKGHNRQFCACLMSQPSLAGTGSACRLMCPRWRPRQRPHLRRSRSQLQRHSRSQPLRRSRNRPRRPPAAEAMGTRTGNWASTCTRSAAASESSRSWVFEPTADAVASAGVSMLLLLRTVMSTCDATEGVPAYGPVCELSLTALSHVVCRSNCPSGVNCGDNAWDGGCSSGSCQQQSEW